VRINACPGTKFCRRGVPGHQKKRMGDIPLSAITGCIILIEGPSAGLFYSGEIACGICYDLDPRAGVIRGAFEDHSIPEKETRVFALVSMGKKMVKEI
jgi:hypothetical protein